MRHTNIFCSIANEFARFVVAANEVARETTQKYLCLQQPIAAQPCFASTAQTICDGSAGTANYSLFWLLRPTTWTAGTMRGTDAHRMRLLAPAYPTSRLKDREANPGVDRGLAGVHLRRS